MKYLYLKNKKCTKSTICTQKRHKVLDEKLSFFLIQLEANLKLAVVIMNLGSDSKKLDFPLDIHCKAKLIDF